MTVARRKNTSYDQAWLVASGKIASRKLRGLEVWCPACRRRGTVVSKWVSGRPVKPLYVTHRSKTGRVRACRLKDEDVAKARVKVRFTSIDVLKTLRMGRPFVLFSGGMDSLSLLEYMRNLASQAGREITALHADTTAGFPEVEEFVRDVCEDMGVPLVVVKPWHDYFDLAKRWGIPGVKSRWCCETLKIAPIRRYLSEIDGPKVIYDGIRAAESNLRATYVPVWYHPAFRSISVSPLFHWSDNRVRSYIARKGLPSNPTSDMGTSGECWCGAYKCKADFEALVEVHPEIFDKLVEVEQAQKGKFTFLYEKGQRIPLSSIRSKSTNGNGKLDHYRLKDLRSPNLAVQQGPLPSIPRRTKWRRRRTSTWRRSLRSASLAAGSRWHAG